MRFNREGAAIVPACSPERTRSDFRDIQHGVNDPVDGVDVQYPFSDNKTPHERAQRHADVRADATAVPSEALPPERLRRKPTDPINPRTGRNPTD